MKLLTRINLSYLAISVVVFVVCGMIFYQLLQTIFRAEIDDALKVEQMLVEQTINYSDSVPDFRLVFGHMIDVTILQAPLKQHGFIHDTLMYDPDRGEFASFRHLFAENTSVRNRGYTINIYRSLSETESLITEILIAITLIFLVLMATLVIANYFISKKVWIPFHRILGKLGHYRIDQHEPLQFRQTPVHEFNLLTEALTRMSKKISLDYRSLKEFNENAAHELQTPLAVISSKLELLVQSENLGENQMRLISGIFEATAKISKMNQGLLLLSKIDNDQFHQTEPVDLQDLANGLLRQFADMIEHKNLKVSTSYVENVILMINRPLAETFFTNLLTNAIRHNVRGGFIRLVISRHSVTVENSGPSPGIEPELLFERFRKSGSHPDSSGLGLSIMKRIAALYDMALTYRHSEETHHLTLVINPAILQN